jgi:hypothetical protein
MSAETASSTRLIDIYVPLLNEGTDVLRPTKGRHPLNATWTNPHGQPMPIVVGGGRPIAEIGLP